MKTTKDSVQEYFDHIKHLLAQMKEPVQLSLPFPRGPNCLKGTLMGEGDLLPSEKK